MNCGHGLRRLAILGGAELRSGKSVPGNHETAGPSSPRPSNSGQSNTVPVRQNCQLERLLKNGDAVDITRCEIGNSGPLRFDEGKLFFADGVVGILSKGAGTEESDISCDTAFTYSANGVPAPNPMTGKSQACLRWEGGKPYKRGMAIAHVEVGELNPSGQVQLKLFYWGAGAS